MTMFSLAIEPYKTDRSDFRLTVNRRAAELISEILDDAGEKLENDVLKDFAFNISSALERWK